jgi:sortase A
VAGIRYRRPGAAPGLAVRFDQWGRGHLHVAASWQATSLTAVDTREDGQDSAADSSPPSVLGSPEQAQEKPPSQPLPARKGFSLRVPLQIVSVLICVLAVWFLLFAFVLSALQEHGTQARLYDRFRSELPNGTAPLGPPIKVGAPVALITAPAAGLHNVVVVEGSSSRQLSAGPGHLSDSPLPGQYGTSVILGRSVTYGAPFCGITRFKPGDTLTVTTGEGVFTYRVEDVRYPGDPLPAPVKGTQSRLTLVTSASSGWRSGWAPTHTVYVDALAVHGPVQPAPAGLARSVSKSSLPMQGGGNALVPLAFWLEGLVVAAVAVCWSWFRWGRRETWFVGVPILLALLWGTTGALIVFLPNLL